MHGLIINSVSSSVAALVALTVIAASSPGAIYAESAHGDLPDDHLAPLPLTLDPGSNAISGTFGATGVPDVHDLDYISITVPAGHVLDRFTLSDSDIGGAVSFIGIEAGPVVTTSPDAFSPDALLGWAHFGNGDVGRDLLPAIAIGPGAMGFAPPLPEGVYSLWIMELDTARHYSYGFDLTVSPVPAPGALVPVMLLIRAARRRR